MAKEQKPTDQRSEIAEQAMEQARGAADVYFEYLKRTIADTPLGWKRICGKAQRLCREEYHDDPKLFTAAEPSAEFPGLWCASRAISCSR